MVVQGERKSTIINTVLSSGSGRGEKEGDLRRILYNAFTIWPIPGDITLTHKLGFFVFSTIGLFRLSVYVLSTFCDIVFKGMPHEPASTLYRIAYIFLVTPFVGFICGYILSLFIGGYKPALFCIMGAQCIYYPIVEFVRFLLVFFLDGKSQPYVSMINQIMFFSYMIYSGYYVKICLVRFYNFSNERSWILLQIGIYISTFLLYLLSVYM